MTAFSSLRILPAVGAFVVLAGGLFSPLSAFAGMSFCNRTTSAIEAALGYRSDTEEQVEKWISEGWWRIEPGQCARVYAAPLIHRFYFYYAHALTSPSKDIPPTVWSGKYMFCTDTKAFRVEGDGNCGSRQYQSLGFQEIDVGPKNHDYNLDFKDATTKEPATQAAQ